MYKLVFFAAFLLALGACKKDSGVDYAAQDKKIIEDYIAAHSLTALSTTEGIYYVIETAGSPQHPNLYSKVKVHYKGYLTDGSVFDQTDPGVPASFYLYSAIKGWQIGIPIFGRGGKGKLLIPSDYAYGSSSYTGIPAHSVLIFDIVLSDFD
ncbi:MAG: FKBP-type peptidyl-prolyl cis-trans isomerase [Bacteroidetes bacterium]|nr:FKBP-type peptidyl-prolyl cis-trans isomerase [Bacteroidota bacterium]